MKTIKEIYDTKSIDDKGDLIGLQKWYNSVIEKTPEELDLKDVSIMLRQRFFVEIAVEKAIGYLKANPFIGEMYQGQLMVNLLSLPSEAYAIIKNELGEIALKAFELCDLHEDLTEKEKEDFLSALTKLKQEIQ